METLVQENSLISIISETGVEQATAELLQQKFAPFLEQAEEWKAKASELVVTSEDQTDLMKMAREGRLTLKAIRVDADKTRKLLKEDSLRYGRAVQAVYNVIEETIKPIEEHLEQQEKFKELAEAKRRDQLRKERETIVEQYREYVPYGIDFGEITQTDFDKLINGAKLQQQQAEEARVKAEQERIEQEKKEAEEREAMRIENERLKAEAEQREKEIQAERDRIEKEQRAANIAAEKARKEAEAKAAAERKEAEQKIAAERAERERLERELKEKQEAEAKAEAEKQSAVEAELSKGDKQKMLDLIKELGELPFKYQFKSKKHNAIHKAIIELVEKTTNYATSKL